MPFKLSHRCGNMSLRLHNIIVICALWGGGAVSYQLLAASFSVGF
jgi:hypothetical protein